MVRRYFLLFAAVPVVALLLSGCVIVPISLPGPPEVREVTYRSGGPFADKIGIVDVSGVLTAGGESNSFFASDSSVVDFDKKLKYIEEHGSFDAVILRMDTPGGGVTASDIMHHQLKMFKERTDLPVYVSAQTVNASGGYYVSMAADEIYASPTTVTGSVGVISIFPEIKGLMDKIGVDVNSIASGDLKDAGAFYDDMTAEERELYQALVEDMFDRFAMVVREGRPDLSEEAFETAASGRIFTAQQALDLGLIDGVEHLDTVIDLVAEKHDLGTPAVVLVTKSGRSSTESAYAADSLLPPLARAGEQPAQVNLIHMDLGRWAMPTNEVFNYLWLP